MNWRAEHVAFACFMSFDGAIYPIPRHRYPMDIWNYHAGNSVAFQHRTDSTIMFVTTFGNVLTEAEAYKLAIESGQIDETATKGRLTVSDLFKLGG